MRISITLPVVPGPLAGNTFADVEAAGYDGAFTFESSHDPFLPLALGATHTTRLTLGSAVAIGFARNPMVLANIGHDLQLITEGRFVLGIGSQIRPHIERRFSESWSRPAARMAEMVRAIRAIWSTWETGARLDFRGEFYQHTLMTPAFDPGPNPFGTPPIAIGGFGTHMVQAAGEVADTLIVHPFNTARTVADVVVPALAQGAARAARPLSDIDLIWVTMVVPWHDEQSRAQAMTSAKGQLAFYASTPAYRPTLQAHGWDDLHQPLNALSKQGRWLDMINLVPDELVETIAVCGPRDEIAGRIVARLDGLSTHVGLVNSRQPDPSWFADIVADLRAAQANP